MRTVSAAGQPSLVGQLVRAAPESPVSRGARTVALVVPGSLDTPTGGYAYDRRLATELAARGWTVDIVRLDDGFPFPVPDALRRADQALAALPDGALALCDGLAFGAMPAAARAHRDRLTLVALVHHPLALETGLDAATAATLADSERDALACARAVVVTSPNTARLLAGYDVAADRITVALPGTERAVPAAGTRSADATQPVHLLAVASLVPRKGHALLLDALTRLRDLPWRLTCVGSLALDPPTAQAIRATVSARGLDERITFVGAVPSGELARFYDAADVFVMPTFYEGYGMAVAEAVAHGLPVVGSRTGGIPDLVDERSGILLPPGALDPLTTALDRVIRDDAWRATLASGAAARAATLPTWSDTAAAVERALLAAIRHGELQR
jgi:glycosyltransferase involved in cell wall biosynthesis